MYKFLFILFFSSLSFAQQTAENDAILSKELIQFLADFNNVDDEMFELMDYHASQDIDKNEHSVIPTGDQK